MIKHSVATTRRRSAFSNLDYCCFLILAAISLYLMIREPLLATLLGGSILLLMGLHQIGRAIPILEKMVGSRIRFWHVATLIMTTAMLSNALLAPVQAVFMSGLENFFIELAESAATGGGATETLNEEVVRLIFSLIRGVFLLLVAAAALFAYNQSQQGNDWRPIVVQVGLAFAIVIAIDVVTFLFVGDGTVASLPRVVG